MKRTSMFSIVIITVMAVTVLLANPAVVDAEDCRIIRIHGLSTHGTIRVEPKILTVSKGTCVIWFNQAAVKEVKVVFKEGKTCASVSDAPMGFSLDHADCYVTSWIPVGGTSSLRFKEAGTFEYVVEEAIGEVGERGKKVSNGTIIVR